MPFSTAITIPDLGPGAGYALWGFRAAATGHVSCPALVNGYEDAFGDFGRPALGALRMLAREIGSAGGRRVTIAAPGCCCVTADELSIVALLSAAQAKDTALCDAHLSWLMCGRGERGARAAAMSLGGIFASAGMTIERPEIELKGPAAVKPFRSFHAAGHA